MEKPSLSLKLFMAGILSCKSLAANQISLKSLWYRLPCIWLVIVLVFYVLYDVYWYDALDGSMENHWTQLKSFQIMKLTYLSLYNLNPLNQNQCPLKPYP